MSPPWTVVLIGGASGNGKTTLAETVGRRFGVPWLQVDDLRLTLQYGGLLTAGEQPTLFAFLADTGVWQKPPLVLRDQLIAIGTLLIPALETVIAHHLATDKLLIIEGDGLVPALLARAALHEAVAAGRLRGAFLTATTAHRRANLAAREERGRAQTSKDTLGTGATMNALYDDWLGHEAARYGVPLVPAQPQATLAARFIATLDLA